MTGSQRNDPVHLLQQAALAHERGLLAEAEQLYKKVLKKDRYHFETICRLGVLRVQQSRFLEAAELSAGGVTKRRWGGLLRSIRSSFGFGPRRSEPSCN